MFKFILKYGSDMFYNVILLIGALRLDREKIMKRIKKIEKSSTEIQKKLLFGFVFLFLAAMSDCSEIPVALLKGIKNNNDLLLNYRNIAIGCVPFGVKPLEVIQTESTNQEECPKAISKMYLHNPNAKHFAKLKLHLEQTYHFNMLDKKCVLYGNGPETYSEMLLSEGLAVLDVNFNNKEWNEKLKKAYTRGEKQKKGIHADNTEVLSACFKKEK